LLAFPLGDLLAHLAGRVDIVRLIPARAAQGIGSMPFSFRYSITTSAMC
jgi:hypothetical protein